MAHSIFLSHNRNDKPFVRKLGHRLAVAGVKVWVDEAEMRLGDSLIEKIQAAIKESDFVGAVLSPDSVTSTWVQRELNMALNDVPPKPTIHASGSLKIDTAARGRRTDGSSG